MDLSYGARYDALREEVRAFLAQHWPPRGGGATAPRDEQIARFRARAIEAGYLARRVPRRYGGSEQPPDVLASQVIREEFRRGRAPGDPVGIGPSMLVPTLLEKGAEWQRERFVPPTIRGELIWCQGYSEPGAGSDLASLRTRAALDGGEWVIHGQKIWTSAAHLADFMFLLCRTEPERPRHGGISYLLLDMKQPGVRVEPLRQMTGGTAFNQVFLDGARTPADWIVGERGEGWVVSRTTLLHERNMIGGAEGTRELFDALVQLAREARIGGRPALEDASIRQRLVALEARVRVHECSSWVQLSRAHAGRPPARAQMMNKLYGTGLAQEVARIALDLIGDGGLVAPDADVRLRVAPDTPERWVGQFMSSLGAAIAGGTANVQRNIVAERGFGLPRDFAAQRG